MKSVFYRRCSTDEQSESGAGLKAQLDACLAHAHRAKNWVPAADRQSVSFRLRDAIEADGRSAYAIGQAAKVDPGMIQRFVNGERGLSLATVDRLAQALGLRLVEAARGRGRPARDPRPASADRPTPPPMPGPEAAGDPGAHLAGPVAPVLHPEFKGEIKPGGFAFAEINELNPTESTPTRS